MKSHALKFMRVAVGCLLTATLLFSGSSAMVLCIGDDGHFEVEPAHQGPCGRTGNAHDRATAEVAQSVASPSGNGAGRCVDVSLGLDNLSHVVNGAGQDRLTKNAVAGDFLADYVALLYPGAHRTPNLTYETPPRLSHVLLVQRTIVLLI